MSWGILTRMDKNNFCLIIWRLIQTARGDNTVLTLESRSKQIITKYRSVEKVTGPTATTSPSTTTSSMRRTNPSRAKRSRLRLEKFNQKKEDEKLDQQEIGSQSPAVAEATSTKLIIELDKEMKQGVETPLHSPILQVDGPIEEENMKYTFKSEYAEEDLIYTIEEIFPEKNANLESIVQCRPKSAECLCTVIVKFSLEDQKPLLQLSPWCFNVAEIQCIECNYQSQANMPQARKLLKIHQNIATLQETYYNLTTLHWGLQRC